ncbi:MAG: 23S rRNA (pseudouridine(1915)-N(3))-methyltransferase RlmH [Pseudomonadota bacterium]
MKIHLLAIGHRMPAWIEAGYHDYAKRLGRDCQLLLKEIPSPRKSKSQDSATIKQAEGELLLAAIPASAYPVALDETGKLHPTSGVAQRLGHWIENYPQVALLVGGADGLSADCLSTCRERWSLSPMTFPHALVRVIVAEQIYRAYSLMNNHPYHRA